MEFVFLVVIGLLALWVIALPVKLAAAAMGAERTDMFWCLVALAGSSIMHAIGLAVPCVGSVIAFLLSGVAFAAILGTGFLRGIGIQILVVIFSAILVGCLSIVLGFSLVDFMNTVIEILSEIGLPVGYNYQY